MSRLREAFDERLDEVHAYLHFLEMMGAQAQSGSPKFQDAVEAITPQQQKLLYASVYLQLYNLVEATMTSCIESVAHAMSTDQRWTPHDLSDVLRKEWTRSTARTHVDLNYSKRLEAAMQVVDHLVASDPVSRFEIDRGGGGNWDDRSIQEMSARLGCDLVVSRDVHRAIKRPVRDDKGPLALVKAMRNALAHGNISFAESADQVSVSELESLAQAVIDYLDEVVNAFAAFVTRYGYLIPERRPTGAS